MKPVAVGLPPYFRLVATEDSEDPRPDRLDLSDSVDVVTRLLDERVWRSRVVEQVEIDRSYFGRTVRSLQVAPLRPIIGDLFPRSTKRATSKIVLPVMTLPKGPLVNFDLTAPLGQAFLLKRRAIAEFEARYVEYLAKCAGIAMAGEVLAFVTAIAEFTPGTWQNKFYSGSAKTIEADLKSYLDAGLGRPSNNQDFKHWSTLSESIGSTLEIALDEGISYSSSANTPILALPLISELLGTPADVTARLEELHSFVEECVRQDGPVAPALQVLADYGLRYEALVECEVPLDDAFTIKTTRDVNLNTRRTGRVDIEAVFDDAISNHLAVRVSDPDVKLQLGDPEPRDLLGEPLPENTFDLVRATDEDFVVYGSEEGRSHRIVLPLRVRPSLNNLASAGAFAAISLAVGVVLLALPKPLTTDDAALLVVPTTLIAGLVLAQQRTTIAGRLLNPLRLVSLLVIIGLWCIVIVLLANGEIVSGPNG